MTPKKAPGHQMKLPYEKAWYVIGSIDSYLFHLSIFTSPVNNHTDSNTTEASASTEKTEGPNPKSTLEEFNELSLEIPSSQQTPGGISLPIVLPAASPESDIETEDEDDDDDQGEGDDDDVDDDEYHMESAEWKAKSRDRTRKFVRDFLDSAKAQHIIDMKIRRLVGENDFKSWLSAIETQLRMHQVWEIVEDELTMLATTDDLYRDMMQMKDVACALIFANVSQEIRECPCVYKSLRDRDPCMMMGTIHAHFGPEGTGGENCH
ncbi:uncharacterized protein N7484_001406 [Penicillium longicatenatum]|uniref:uncharacterized protein n=1 Tax=Penicillium longicatenatum TaxID=1561947 RepID=UPI0025488101|nr:uncharacterized protein N7484_001406 [Penicillium longicatenatum]KAJ5657757.1 hypothetical protein N7484_001406 [Penicillium longicatenatum]